MLAIIIIAIIVAIAVIFFAVRTANLHNAIEGIYAKQALLQENSHDHEDRIDVNYKSIAELNRRQDEAEKAGIIRYHDACRAIHEIGEAVKGLQDYNAEREKKAREAVEEFKNTMNCIAEIARKRAKKAAKAKETPAKQTAQASDTPATGRQEPRDAKQTAQVNREHFAELRKTMSVREAQEYMGISRTTAKRYEKWRKAQEQ